jgi:hypothetical protein
MYVQCTYSFVSEVCEVHTHKHALVCVCMYIYNIYTNIFFLRLGRGDGKMSSMMVHGVSRCVIKIVFSLSIRTPQDVHRKFQKHAHTYAYAFHIFTYKQLDATMITSHRIQTCAQEFSERILAHREFLSMPTFIACVPMSLKGASWKWACLCKGARSKTSRRTWFRQEISCCIFLSSSLRAFCLFVCVCVCVQIRAPDPEMEASTGGKDTSLEECTTEQEWF